MRRIVLIVGILTCLRMSVTAQNVIMKGSSAYSLSAATATGNGTALAVTPDSYGNFPTSWTYTVVFTGSPTATVTNLRGSIDWTTVTGSVAESSTTLTVPFGSFIATDVGKDIIVTGAGAAGADLTTTIAAVTDSRTVTLTDAATTAASAVSISYGRWFTLDSSTTTTSEMRHVVNKPVTYIRCQLATLTNGTAPKSSCRISGF